MSTLSTTISPRQWEVLLLAGLEVPARTIHGGRRVISWEAEETPRLFWTLKQKMPRHKRMAEPYWRLQIALFCALRHYRATHG